MGTAAITLPSLTVAGAGHTGLAQSGTATVVLPQAHICGYGKGRVSGGNRVVLLTGDLLSDAGGLFQFSGTPNTAVVWSISVGSGSITALSNQTDSNGNAWARYDAGGYTGLLTVQVNYGN